MATEKLDVFDKNGNILGYMKERNRIHTEGDWHKSVHVWIINKRKEILIQKRSQKNKISPGFWTISASGHVKAGTTPKQTAIEEVKEELGINLQPKEISFLTCYHKSKNYPEKGLVDNEFNPIFVVRKEISLKEANINKKEVEKVKYIHFDELEAAIKSSKISFKPDKKRYHKILFNYFRSRIKKI